jgi:anti-sigma28 factor (negative regulator of flagellin synthesis)
MSVGHRGVKMRISNSVGMQPAVDIRRAEIENRYMMNKDVLRRAANSASDKVEFSSEGRELNRMRQVLMQSAAELSDVREDVVSQIKQKITTGFYNREDVVNSISDKILDSASEKVSDESSPQVTDSYRSDLMNDVNEKINNGFYSDTEVMAFVADRLLNIYEIE